MKLTKILGLCCLVFTVNSYAEGVEESYEEASFQDTSYPQMLLPIRQAVADGDVAKAIDRNSDLSEIPELELLNELENARLQQLKGDVATSKELYAKAITSVPKTQDEMLDRAKDIILDKDTYNYYDVKTKYYLPDYAITFLYTYQALNHLKSNDVEDALSSLDAIGVAQDWVKQQNIIAAGIKEVGDKYLQQDNIKTKTLGLDKFTELNAMLEFSERIPNAYGNPMADYLKAILIEKKSKDYKKALAAIEDAQLYAVGNAYLDKTVKEYQKAIDSQTSPYSMGMGRVVVFYEKGLANSKLAVRTPLKLGDLGKLTFAFPYYSVEYDYPEPVKVDMKTTDGQVIADTYTEIMYDTNLFTTKSLVEEYSKIVTRDVVIEAAKVAKDKNAKGLGGLLGNHLKFDFSQDDPRKADLRSWLMLPASTQLFTQQIDSGDYVIQVDHVRQNIKVEQGKNTLLWIVDIGKFKKVYYFIL